MDNTEKILRMTGLAVKAGKVKFGVFQSLAACDSGRAKLIIIPKDLGGSNRHAALVKCEQTSVPLITVSDKAELGKAVGRDSAASLAICDENFKSAILKLYGGGVND